MSEKKQGEGVSAETAAALSATSPQPLTASGLSAPIADAPAHKLSDEMSRAFVALQQGRLIRYHGGFWAHDNSPMMPGNIWGGSYPLDSFGVQTLRGLVKRGLAHFTGHDSKTIKLPRFGKPPVTQTRMWETVCELLKP